MDFSTFRDVRDYSFCSKFILSHPTYVVGDVKQTNISVTVKTNVV